MTLVEVVCGLALAGSLLVSLILAHSAHAKQIHQAHKKLKALQSMNSLATEWERTGFPDLNPLWQPLSGDNELLYRIVLARRQINAARLKCRIYQLQVCEATRADRGPLLISADFLVPIKHD
jgi:hypothetical protein